MKNDGPYNRLRELSWRRKLTPTEQAELDAWLAAHPEAVSDWEAEAALNQALRKLPDVPVATNFTACVLQVAERQAAADMRRSQPWWGWWRAGHRWLPRLAFATLLLTAGIFSYHHVQDSQRIRTVDGVRAVSEVASLPSPEILRDFDAIRALPATPPPDEELLKLMQ